MDAACAVPGDERQLDDPNVTVEVDAAEALARHGGTNGLLAVLENLGRRGDDGDSDFVAYKLNELNATQVVKVFEIADSIGVDRLSTNQKLGVDDVREVGGDVRRYQA